ncbi:peptide deformylase [Stomatohabitans albus]|uniref:peptide deformylase n=1 Tax=Stomatohabitans albus TaxID=3110766 RepID=UPI00300D86F5
MAILPVRLFGDPVLRQEARPVETFDDRLRALADNMMETMKAHNGLGLAGNQVGVLQRIFTWEEPDLEAQGAVINPLVEWTSEEQQEGDEGCLSFPGLFYPTKRPLEVVMKGLDPHGEELTLEGAGLLARIILHEIDHLNGVLFIDHLALHDRKAAMKRIRAGELEQNQLRL